MKSRNKPRRKGGGNPSWQIPLLIVLIILLIAALGLAFWLSRAEESPPGGEADTATAGSQQMTEEPTGSSAGSSQPETTVPETGPEETVPIETTVPQTEPEQSAQSGTQSNPGTSQGVGVQTGSSAVEETEPAEVMQLTCSEYSMFSGQFVEDGRDELVSNVAAILVSNVSEKFLDLATITFYIDGKTATFVVTGLPAGRSAWVLESSRLTVTNDSVFTYVDMTTSFRDGVAAASDKVAISVDGNMLTATNNTGETLEGVFVYYRTLHTDGNFLGGITYLVDFGTLEPGASVEKMGGHYSGDSEIVRIGWQE